MTRKSLLSRLLPAYLGFIAISLAVMSWMAARDMGSFYYDQKVQDLSSLARVASGAVEPHFETPAQGPRPVSLGSWCNEFAGQSGTRVTIVEGTGKVLCDSERDPGTMDDHSSRPEIRQAWEEGVGSSSRYSYTLEANLLYVAVPIGEQDRSPVIRVAVPISTIADALWSLRTRLLSGAAIAGTFIILITIILSRRITFPLSEIRRGVDRYAKGEFGAPIRVRGTREFTALAEAMNSMAQQLDERINTVVNQRNELEAVLSSMVEGVLAFDTNRKLISLNQAASVLLGTGNRDVLNRPIQEAVRNSALQKFVTRTLSNPEPVEEEIIFYNGQERFLQAHGTPLNDVSGQRIGALVVLNDVTNIRRLENIRREFVANASHEIRTPITSIKGFVETLLDGALEDPETTERFLHIIRKHSDRLNAIVEDLLSLSKIEMEVETGEVYFQKGSILEIVEEAVEACHTRIEEKNIQVSIDCPEDLHGRINPSLLVQALINLIDNAIKYSEEGGAVTITSQSSDDVITISVQDLGVGIEGKHIPRLFERFYRIDKARSRTLGGTGLGLAIVKHIVQVHNGEVNVDSTPGKGSTFTISLPG